MDALRAFEEHALAFVPRLFKLGRHVRQVRNDARRDGHHFIEHGIHGQSVDAVQCREQDILFLEGGGDLRFEQVGIGQIRGAHAHAAHLVFIAGPDAATGGPDLLALFELVLAGLVQHLVVRHDEVGLRADLEASSSTNTTGSRTTPFPIRQILPSCRMPEGTRWSAAFLPSTMTVCPALFPP